MSPADLTAELEQLHAAAFGWALSCCGWDRTAAEDVLQASYLKLLDGRARFEGRSSLRTFLLGVIARTAREARRRSALRRWLPLASLVLGPEAVDGRPDPAMALTRADETARLGRALRRLSTRPPSGCAGTPRPEARRCRGRRRGGCRCGLDLA